MPSSPRTSLLASALALSLALPAAAQVYVGTRRPGQSGVRYAHHEWRRAELLVGEGLDTDGAVASLDPADAPGVRLYFYEAERDVAERAAAAIEQAWRELAVDFGHVPEHPVPYVLYSTYLDFLSTNLFPVQEGTLGVTSTRDLTVALPYFGDHPRFVHVSKHELTHEFTIQKVRSVAREAGTGRDPLAVYPLWFVEGLAEFYSQGEITGEAAMLARDLVANADIRRYWGPLGFFDDAPGSVLWTYQVGHLRCAFLEEVYGAGTLQALLERTPEVYERGMGGSGGYRGFPWLVERVTGDEPERVEAAFHSWLRERVFSEWLARDTRPEDLELLTELPGYTLGLSASPDGTLLASRAIDLHTGRAKIHLADARDPRPARRVTADARPGSESLHPVDARTVAVGDAIVAWSALSRGADVIAWRSVSRDVRWPEDPADDGAVDPDAANAADADPPPPRVRIRLGPTRRLRLDRHGLVGATGLALSPEGDRLAFVGLSPAGRTDLYVVDLDEEAVPRRLTDDPYAERTAAWGRRGVAYASDATSHGHPNLFLVDPSGGPPTRLTNAPQDHLDPSWIGERLLFTAWDEAGLDLYEWTEAGVARRTRASTGLSQPGPAEDGVWALLQDGGWQTPARVPAEAWLDEPAVPQPPDTPAAPPARRDLAHAAPYRPLDPRNWRLENTLGYFGAGSAGIYGQLYVAASDQLRDRGLVVSAAAFGSLRLSDGYLAFVDQSRRTTWAGGAFQSLRFRIDDSFDDLRFQSAERTYGLLGSLRHPLDRYAYVQLDLSAGGTQYFLLQGDEDYLARRVDAETGRTYLALWEERNGAARPQADLVARFGLDTVRYHPTTGPHGGGSVLVEAAWATQPFHGEGFGHLRVDAERYAPIRLPIAAGANVGIRGGLGTSGGGFYARSFFLSSFDTVRGVRFGDADRLLGRHFAWASAEAQVPLDAVLNVAILSSVEAIAGVDGGMVADELDALWERRVVDVALGANLVLGPLVFRVHFARPLDVGAPLPATGSSPWVPNLSLRWLSL